MFTKSEDSMLIVVHELAAQLELCGSELERYLKSQAAERLQVDGAALADLKIVKKSVDARNKNNVRFVYSVQVRCDLSIDASKFNKCTVIDEDDTDDLINGNEHLAGPIVIVGTGPAGLFCALELAKRGYAPYVIERGSTVNERKNIIESFWNGQQFSAKTNVQFGEGGAGTFSDGKLVTRIGDKRCKKVLEAFVDAGAKEDILFEAKPHVGTDKLQEIIPNIREKIIEYGGTVVFDSCLENIEVRKNSISKIKINDDWIDVGAVVLAIGHSARDTYKMLFDKGVVFQPKQFSVGVRIEHLQSEIDRAQYGKFAGNEFLGAAEYQLYTNKLPRNAYTFCMCPGGVVVAAASEENSVVTNGMSYSARDGRNANAALVANVNPTDFSSDNPLAGMEFQRKLEQKACAASGSQFAAPVQLAGDFLDGKCSNKFGEIKPSYTGETVFADINDILPRFVCDTLGVALKQFGQKISAYNNKNAVLTGVETRTSAPVRILRNSEFEAIAINNLYPAGEGAGYAGGITSAAVDGINRQNEL